MKFNTPDQPRKIILAGVILSSLLLLQACGSKKGITINSEPQGADILADGKNIGKTPMNIKQDDVFPPHWYGGSYMVKGELKLQKEGCNAVSMEVNDLVLSTDIKKTLTCEPGVVQTQVHQDKPVKQASEVKPAEKAPAKAAETAPLATGSIDSDIEKRLNSLKQLHDKGVISSKEYAEQRKRILESI